mgnify:CR=1 FL=1
MSYHDLSNTQSSGIKWSGDGSLRVRILNILSTDSRVNKRNDTAKLGGFWKSGVVADGWDGHNEGVEVLLSGYLSGVRMFWESKSEMKTYKSTRSCHSLGGSSKLGDDVVGLSKLSAWVGSSKEELNGSTCKSSSLSRLTEVGQSTNSSDGTIALLLAKASLSDSCEKGDENGLREHVAGIC